MARDPIIRSLLLLALPLVCALGVRPAHAYQCPTPVFVYQPGAALAASEALPPVEASADRVVSDEGVVSLDGNTSIIFDGREIAAENAQYNPDTAEVTIDGALKFRAEGIRLDSSNARFDMDDNLFSAGESSYELNINGKRATGSASTMSRDTVGHFTLEGATYSTCPPGDKSWFIKADSITLKPDEGIGTAKGIKLNFKGVPLLAVPAFSFPISPDRKTGFLAPIVARGDRTGLELHIPWYWNIRPNLDATITPRLMSKRGAQLQTELRYLNEQGSWQLDNEVLRDTDRDGEQRHFTQLRHTGVLSSDIRTSILASRTSDANYFEDLGNSLQLASITHLEQRADLTYIDGAVTARARLQSYQTVDDEITPSERPYRRLPQLTLSAQSPRLPLGAEASINSELVYFDRNIGVTGTRFDIQPELSLPVSRDAWFITPKASTRYTYYNLNNRAPGENSQVNRHTTSVSVDSGLYFDRILNDTSKIQTLEPRVFYLRVPYEQQDDVPLFDSSAYDFNISQLFRENRFAGGDRVADAEQVSVALTSRYLDNRRGLERFRGSVGQIFYFADRRVELDEDADDSRENTRNTSDFVAEVSAEFKRDWYGKANLQWNPDSQQTQRGSLLLSYRPASNKIINVAHRRVNTDNRAETEQIDLQGLWPIHQQWQVAARWNYSLEEEVSIESLLGLEYNSCCWAFRFAARRFISDNGEGHDTNLYLQLVLKGLAPLGQNYGALLENAILGYQDEIE